MITVNMSIEEGEFLARLLRRKLREIQAWRASPGCHGREDEQSNTEALLHLVEMMLEDF